MAAVDHCILLGNGFSNVTAHVSPAAPSALSIIRSDNKNTSLRFEDIPCPSHGSFDIDRSDKQLSSGHFLHGLYPDLDPSFRNCTSAVFTDDLVGRLLVNLRPLKPATQESGPGHGGHPHLHPPRDARNVPANEP